MLLEKTFVIFHSRHTKSVWTSRLSILLRFFVVTYLRPCDRRPPGSVGQLPDRRHRKLHHYPVCREKRQRQWVISSSRIFQFKSCTGRNENWGTKLEAGKKFMSEVRRNFCRVADKKMQCHLKQSFFKNNNSRERNSSMINVWKYCERRNVNQETIKRKYHNFYCGYLQYSLVQFSSLNIEGNLGSPCTSPLRWVIFFSLFLCERWSLYVL